VIKLIRKCLIQWRQRGGGSPPPARTHSPITDHSLSHGHIDLHRQFNHYCFSPIYKEKCFSFNGCADSNETYGIRFFFLFFACSDYFSTIQKTYMCTVNKCVCHTWTWQTTKLIYVNIFITPEINLICCFWCSRNIYLLLFFNSMLCCKIKV